MAESWKEKISDAKERKVFEALSDPAWDFRTAEGISVTAGLSEPEVREILDMHPDFIRQSAIPDGKGRELFTLRSKPEKYSERFALLRMFVTKSVR